MTHPHPSPNPELSRSLSAALPMWRDVEVSIANRYIAGLYRIENGVCRRAWLSDKKIIDLAISHLLFIETFCEYLEYLTSYHIILISSDTCAAVIILVCTQLRNELFSLMTLFTLLASSYSISQRLMLSDRRRFRGTCVLLQTTVAYERLKVSVIPTSAPAFHARCSDPDEPHPCKDAMDKA